MNIRDKHPIVQVLLAASLVLTVINLGFRVADRFKKDKKCSYSEKG